METLWETIWTADWWISNLGQIVGVFLGAFLAFLFGVVLTTFQFRLSHRKEKMVLAKTELEYLNRLRKFLMDTHLKEFHHSTFRKNVTSSQVLSLPFKRGF